jgi:hypothetical protein
LHPEKAAAMAQTAIPPNARCSIFRTREVERGFEKWGFMESSGFWNGVFMCGLEFMGITIFFS